MGNENTRHLGFQADITWVEALPPQTIDDVTPILSAAIDTRLYRRGRILLVTQYQEVGATAHTVTLSVTESATSGGSYTAATKTGALAAHTANGGEVVAIKRNPAKPFLKVTATGSHLDVDGIVGAQVLFLSPAV